MSDDLAPVPASNRHWGTWSMAALWISMSACVPTYMGGASLIDGGMNWWQATLTIYLANTIVLVQMVLNAHPGTKYGIPFPVLCRAAFGTLGSNIPALMRAVVACGWFGIQTWIGGMAIYKITAIFVPDLAAWPPLPVVGASASELACFLLFWAINMAFVLKGIDSIRILLQIKAPLLIALGLLLLVWARGEAGGFGPMLNAPSQFDEGQAKAGQLAAFFAPALTAMIGFWATLSLNIPDFSRYARSQRAQAVGQALGLPTTMGLFSFIGIAVTSATVVIYGQAIWDPVDLLTRFTNPLLLLVAMAALCIATLATNLAANVVSPANDFANLAPRRISFRMGGLLTGIIGILIMPWKLIADPSGFIFVWLVGYAGLLGPIGGILICDYFVVRRRQLDVNALYEERGQYRYTGGFSLVAIAALAAGIAPSVPGFLATVGAIDAAAIAPWWQTLYGYSWFVGFGVSFILYWLLRRVAPERNS